MMKKTGRAKLFGLDLLIVTIVFTGAFLFEAEDREHTVADIHQNLLERGTLLSGQISAELTKRRMIGSTLATALQEYPDMTDSQYQSFAASLREDMLDIRNIALVQDLVVTRIYPIAGNEPALGVDFQNNPDMRFGIERALNQQRTTFVGPLELVQGGRGLILRVPVPGGRDNDIVSIVLDAPAFFTASGLTAKLDDLKIAIRRQEQAAGSPAHILGDQAIFDQDAVTLPFGVESETWELGLVPAAGWPAVGNNLVVITLLSTLFAGLAIIANHVLHHFRHKGQVAQQQLADAVETIDGGFALFDDEDRLVMCNSKYREIYKKSADVLQPGRPFRDILISGLDHGQYPEAVGREADWLEERLAAHQRADRIIEQKLDDGTWLRVSESKTSDGGIVGFRVDITDLKHAREEAEAANRATSEFLTNINHEIRTPLSSVIGFVAFLAAPGKLPSHKALMKALDDPDIPKSDLRPRIESFLNETEQYAQRAQASAKHLLDLVNDTLDLAKIHNGGLNLAPEAVELCPMIRECLLQFSTLASQKGLTLVDDCTPKMVWVDRVRFRQVMLNLIGNAVKFTDSGHVRVSSRCEGDRVRITVEDTGPGIAPKYRDRIFDRFWQADGSVTRKHGGSGLGLAITRELVELHGGKIACDTEENQGSRFTILLPTKGAATGFSVQSKQVA